MSQSVPRIFDPFAIRRAHARAAWMGGDYFLLEEAVGAVAARIAAVNRHFGLAWIIELPDPIAGEIGRLARASRPITMTGHETLPTGLPAPDLIASALALHAVNDLPGLLAQIRRALKPDGLFVAALFGGETLTELRQSFAAAEIEITGGASPRVAPFADVRDLGALLQRAGFALPVADVERTVVRYREPMRLFADLRAMGETNALVERSRKTLRRDVLRAALAHYAENFADPDGRLRATFDIVYLTGWAPHESQQKPLKPGSAAARLADALGTDEKSAG